MPNIIQLRRYLKEAKFSLKLHAEYCWHDEDECETHQRLQRDEAIAFIDYYEACKKIANNNS